jgi:hypothetical protein
MTRLIIVTLAITIFSISSVFAEHPDRASKLTEKIYNKIERLQRMANRGLLEGLGEDELAHTHEKLKSAIQIIRGRYNPRDPRRPQRGNDILVEGFVESHVFSFEGNTVFNIFDQCLRFVKGKNIINKVNDIKLSVNNQDFIALHNDYSYWSTAQSICEQIEIQVEKHKNGQGEYRYNLLEGRVGDNTFSFSGETPFAIASSCFATFLPSSTYKVKNIVVSVNGGDRVSYRNSYSYWTQPFSICNVILKTISQ